MADKNKYHQDATPLEQYKFDPEADRAAQAGIQPLYDTNGNPIVMPGTFKKRVAAQMESHKNPKNRVK